MKNFPKNRIAWTIGDQVIRSVGLTGANIAEGLNWQTKRDIIHFFIMLRGSAESEAWSIWAENQKLIFPERLKDYLGKLLRIRKMTNSFCAKLRKSYQFAIKKLLKLFTAEELHSQPGTVSCHGVWCRKYQAEIHNWFMRLRNCHISLTKRYHCSNLHRWSKLCISDLNLRSQNNIMK